jgi:hypothetical protein
MLQFLKVQAPAISLRPCYPIWVETSSSILGSVLEIAKILAPDLTNCLSQDILDYTQGAIAQLVAHFNGIEGVSGSNPLSSIVRGSWTESRVLMDSGLVNLELG